ncbi:NACHT domain-containing protein [Streptomyces sp. NPDC059352]|uniref:NACHT domain-containing protein n=1 Tax=Streptomyces sp. NPDC059352 TaxID=3346810 RepID=UPI0036A5AAE5
MGRGDEARRRFAEWLREVHRAAGTPSGDELAKDSVRAAGGGRTLSSSTVQRLLAADFVRPPDWDVVTAFLDGCVRCAPLSKPVPAALVDRELWKDRHQQLVSLCEAAKDHGRNRSGEKEGEEDEPAAVRALETYARRVRESYGRLDLEVLTPDNDQSVQPNVELREVFVVPTVRADPPPVELSRELMAKLLEGEELAPDGELPPGLDLELLDAVAEEYRQRPEENVLEVLARAENRRVVLLGDPGAGKSTLAHYLALYLTGTAGADGHDPHRHDPAGHDAGGHDAGGHDSGGHDSGGRLAALAGSVPLVVELRHYAQPAWRQKTFEDFLEHLWATEGMSLPGPVLRRLLGEGRVILVFDGLDEIFDPEFRAETARRIAGFAARHERCRVVVTSRVVGYQRQALDGAEFAHYMIQDLDTPRIHAFARRWFTNACPGQPALTEQLLTRFTDAVAHSSSVRELAGNPLLLTILAILGRRQTLPRDRHGVYQHAVTVLVARWDRDAKHLTTHLSGPVADALDVLGQEERLEMLRLLARRMQEGAGGISGNYIPERDIEDVFRQYLQLCDIPPDVARRAARAMVQQLRERNFILARYGGGAWGFVHRTFLEYLAAADIVYRYEHEREWTPQALVSEVLVPRAEDTTWHEVILLLAGQLRERDTGTLVDSLVGSAPSVDRPGRLALALRALAEVRKIGVLAAQSTAVVDGITRFLEREPDHTVDYFLSRTTFPTKAVTPAMASFSEYWVGRERYLTWFHVWGQFLGEVTPTQLACALHRDMAAVIAYARLAWSAGSRIAALTVLEERWYDSPTATEAIKTCAVHDEDVDVRITALNVLGAASAGRERVEGLRSFLESRAVRDPAPGARKEALNHLLRRHPDDRSRRFFEDRALRDRFDAVRAQAEVLVDRLAGLEPEEEEWPLRAPGLLSSSRWTISRADTLDLDAEESPEREVERALTDWRSERHEPLVDLIDSLHQPEFEQALSSWLQSHPDDLRMLMRDVERISRLPPNRTGRVSHNSVWRTALSAVSLVPSDEARDFLIGCVKDSDATNLRSSAAFHLLKTWADDSSVRVRLLDIAHHDGVPVLRLTLLQQLAHDRPHDPAVREAVYRSAVVDPDADVRTFALRWVALWWPDHPAYRELFGTEIPDGAPSTPGERLVRLQALTHGGYEAEWEERFARESDLWVRERAHRVRLLQESPERLAHAVFHQRLLSGFRYVLKDRARGRSRPES